MSARRPGLVSLWVLCLFSIASVTAASEFAVLLDSDNDQFTGCTVSGMAGVDHVFTTVVDDATTRVTGVFGQRCADGTLTTREMVDAGGSPATFDADSGEFSIDTRLPLSFFVPRPGLLMRAGIMVTRGSNSSVLLLGADGGPIMVATQPPRRRAVSTPGRAEGDWSGLAPMAIGGSGSPSLRIVDVSAFSNSSHVFFRVRGQASTNAPTAADDSYSTTPGTPLTVGAPGILGNDTDPRGLPLSAELLDDVNHGTLVVQNDGSFNYTDDGTATRDHFRYRASNGEQTSNIATVEIGIGSRPNRAPVTGDDAYQVPFGGTLSIIPPGVLGNDSDPDLDPLQAILQTSPAEGTVTLDANGSFIYVHGGASTASDSFTYHATDGVELSRETTVHINVQANEPPVAVDDVHEVAEGGSLTIAAPGLLANDSDPDGTVLTTSVVSQPAHGSVDVESDGSFTYAHDGSETVSDEFTYLLSDGAATDTAVVRITVQPRNDAPTAVNNTYTVAEDGTLTISAPGVLGNDTDPDSSVTRAILASSTTNGTLTLNENGSFTYTPNPDFNGTDSFTYRAGDSTRTSANTATVTITVTPVNDVPSFTAGANVTVTEDSGAYSAAWATAISSGPNESDPLTFNVSNDNNGLFAVQPAIAAAGTLTFTTAGNANGTATVTVSLSDAVDSTAPITFTITVTAVNDAPSFTSGGDLTVPEDSGAYSAAWASAISAGPADEAGQAVAFTATNDNNALFAAQPAISPTGVLTFTPAADANGTVTVTVSATDNGTPAATSAAQTFTITITAVNDAPSFTSGGNVATAEDTPLNAIWATSISAGPADEAGQTLTFNVSNDNNGLFSVQPAISAGGTLTFTPAPDLSGTATVTAALQDNGGGTDTSAPQIFTITVTAVNDAPSFTGGGDVTVFEDIGVHVVGWASAIIAGPPDEFQTVSFNVTNDNNALFAVQPTIAPDGVLMFTPAADVNGSATVTVILTDDGTPPASSAPQTFTIIVTPVNDPPSFTAGGDVTVAEDSGAYSAAWATAISSGPNETDPLAFILSNDNNALFSSQPAIAADGTLTFTTAPDTNGFATVTVSLFDGVASTAPVTFAITVTAVNDNPSFVSGGDVTSLEDGGAYSAPWATSISAGPADEATQTVSFGLTNDNNTLFVSQPVVDASGALSFQAAANAFGSATVTVTATDDGVPSASSAPLMFTITITPVNDEPAFTGGGNVATAEDTPYNAAWAAGISAGPSETQTLTFVVTANTNAALFSAGPSISSTGVLTFTPAANLSGSADVTVELRDDGGTLNSGDDTSAPITFTIDVTPVNDAPLAASQSVSTDEETPVLITLSASDVEGSALTFTAGSAANGSLSAPSAPSCSVAGGISTCTVMLTYTPNADFFGADSFTFTAFDGTDTSNIATVSITVNGVNDAPVNTAPAGPLTVDEGTPYMFSGADLISIADVDAGASAVQVTLQASSGHGTVTLSGTTNLTFSTGSGSGDETMTFTGSIADINSALNGMTFSSTLAYEGPATLTITTNDQGATGSGGALSDSDAIDLTVQRPNDAPVNTVPGPQTINEDAVLTFSTLNAISISDVDAGTANVQVTLSVTDGTLSLGSLPGTIVFSLGDGTDDTSMTFQGPIADINTALDGLTYKMAADDNGSDTLTITTDDLGNTGTGGALTDTDTVAITVNEVNDEPTFTAGADVTVAEDSGAYSAGWATAIDAGANEATQTVSFTVTPVDTTLFSVQPAIGSDGTLTLTPAANAYGTTTVTVTISDDGGTANGGDDTGATVTFDIEITPVNDPPTTTAKTHVTHSGIGITINAASHTGELMEGAADVDDHDPVSELVVELVGVPTPATANVTLLSTTDGSFYFEPPGGLSGNGTASFQFRVCDNGDAGLGLAGVCSANQTVTFNITGPDAWFVDSTPAVACGSCNGSNTKPYANLTSLPAVATRGTADRIYVAAGTYGGHTFAASEMLFGDGSSGSLFSHLGVMTPANGTLDAIPILGGSHPTLTGTVTAQDSITLRGVAINVAGTAFLASGANTMTVLESTVTSTGGRAIDVSNSSSSVTGVNFNSTTATGGFTGILINNVNGTFNLGTAALSGHSGAGSAAVRVNSVLANTNITIGGTINETLGARAVHIGTSGAASTGLLASTASVNISANITGGGVAVYESTGGTLNLTGATQTWNTGTVRGVELVDNNNTTINFSSGNLNITTSTADGFHASEGGTVNVTGSNNIINTTAGSAFETIGTNLEHMTGSMTWKTVNASSGSKGISVQFFDGPFTITGVDGGDAGTDGDAGTGGTISTMTNRGIELINVTGAINVSGMNIVNGGTINGIAATTCGDSSAGDNTNCAAGIHVLSATASTTLAQISINGGAQMGINTRNVTNLVMRNIEVQNVGNETMENGAMLVNTFGTGSITNGNFHDNESRQVHMFNNTGTLSSFTIKGCTFANSDAPNGNMGLILEAAGVGTTMNVVTGGLAGGEGNTFSNLFSNGWHVTSANSANANFQLIGSTGTNSNSLAVAQASLSSNMTVTIDSNSWIAGAKQNAGPISLKTDGGGDMNATVTNNTIGQNGVAFSGSPAACGNCVGMFINPRFSTNSTITVKGNTIQNVNGSAIYVQPGEDTLYNVNTIITGNLIRQPSSNTVVALDLRNGVSGAPVEGAGGCHAIQLGGGVNPGSWPSTTNNAMNRIEGDWGTATTNNEIILIQSDSSLLKIIGYTAGDVRSYVQSQNSITSTALNAASFNVTSVGSISTAGTACP